MRETAARSFVAVLIAGPTASGKSAVALRLAQRRRSTIINADSMQVYRDLRILTARPSFVEETLAPHRLFGEIDGAVNYSTGAWLAAAAAAIEAARRDGRVPILVGGTGLYFKALTQGLSDIPPIPAEVRMRLRGDAEGASPQALHARLAACDPQTAARLRPSDPQRILRALEVFCATGVPLAHFQNSRLAPTLALAHCAGVFLTPDRNRLAGQIDARFDNMMAGGALDEVARLAARRLGPDLPVMRAHGAPPLVAHLRGDMTLEAAIARAKRDTRRYARRQFTFARHQLPDFHWITPEAADCAIVAALDRAG